MPRQSYGRSLGICGNSRSPQRLGRINHGKISAATLHQELRSEKRRRKNFRLENTFTDGDGIARLDEKTSAAYLIEALRVNLENLIATRVMSPHCYSFRRGDAGITASQCNRLQ